MTHAQVQFHPVDFDTTRGLVETVAGGSLHKKQVDSLSAAALGTVHAATIGVHAIGHALAEVRGLDAKHAIKQVDRMLGNDNINVERFFSGGVPSIVQGRSADVRR